MIYVVDGRQQMHFRQLFAAARRWGYGDMKLEHVWFGTILGPDKKPIKTQEGDNIKLKALLAEAEERAGENHRGEADAQQTRPTSRPANRRMRAEMAEHTRAALARVVGLGALKYADLAQNRNLDYVFSWDKLLAFDGNTAPYVQNAYVRIRAIFRKAGLDAGAHGDGESDRTGRAGARTQAARFRRLGLSRGGGIPAPLPLPLSLRAGHAFPQILRVVPGAERRRRRCAIRGWSSAI